MRVGGGEVGARGGDRRGVGARGGLRSPTDGRRSLRSPRLRARRRLVAVPDPPGARSPSDRRPLRGSRPASVS